ncbi:hypothetical protein chiPu_0012379 [Chiloscyllium punctatum]|uniref:Uncharacterized protein n=1 Tax=Chiloscyllium punctatum TaxID=137246 RepID=A0A401SU58_CHIPU|nr:hypothetical protein [Chiloscyllium punctatum]
MGDGLPLTARPSAEWPGQTRLSYPASNSQSRHEQSHSIPSQFGPLPTIENARNSACTRGTLPPRSSQCWKCMKFGLDTVEGPPSKARPSAEPPDEIRLSYTAPGSQSRYEQSHSLLSQFGPLPTVEYG